MYEHEVWCLCVRPLNSPSPPPPLPQWTALKVWCCSAHCKTPAGRPELKVQGSGCRHRCCHSWLLEEDEEEEEELNSWNYKKYIIITDILTGGRWTIFWTFLHIINITSYLSRYIAGQPIFSILYHLYSNFLLLYLCLDFWNIYF